MTVPPQPHCPCGAPAPELLHTFTTPPPLEKPLPQILPGGYHRELWRCAACGHVVSRHAHDLAHLYQWDYVSAHYQDDAGVTRTYERLMALPPESSDNRGRVQNLLAFARQFFGSTPPSPPALLDVGSGLGVFPALMKENGWRVTALDHDPRLLNHLQARVGVKTVGGGAWLSPALGRFDAVTFNKVLEHVLDPTAFLSQARQHLTPGGFLYVEVPDAETAWRDGPDREEFTIDHPHVFSAASLALMTHRAGLRLMLLQRLKEPSTKYTLRAFLCAV